MKILHVVGARPQFVKLSPLLNTFKRMNINSKVLHTGQHYDGNMSAVFFQQIKIPAPDYELNVRQTRHSDMVAKMLQGISQTLIEGNFDTVLVYGDTNSTLAGAIAGRQLGLRVIHYESGVRNYDPCMPEEINRIIIDRVADVLLCISERCLDNMKRESRWYQAEAYNVGDLMFDSFKAHSEVIKEPIIQGEYALITVHRAGNTDDPEKLKAIVQSINEINKEIKLIFPTHPRTRERLASLDLSLDVEVIEPVGYQESLNLVKNSSFVITDSGGVVKEAYWAKKPSILLLDKPPYPQLVDLSVCINCSSNVPAIMEAYRKLINGNFQTLAEFDTHIFGNGESANKIVNYLIRGELVTF